MTTLHTIDPSHTDQPNDPAAQLAASLGISVDELRRRIGAHDAPTVGQHIKAYLAGQGERTRETYATHLNRILRGVGPVCDQLCEPCLKRQFTQLSIDDSRVEDYVCNCDCAGCRNSRVTIPSMRDTQVSTAAYSRVLTETLATVAHRYAIKRGIVHNRRRALRGQPPKAADGHNAAESAIAALRSLYANASKHLGGVNAALEVAKPSRSPNERRPLRDFELAELHLITATGGNDPLLDTLILDTGLATGARVKGIVDLTVGQLRLDTQMIELRDKGGRAVPMPVSRELLDRLVAHAVSRGGACCVPGGPHYVPDSPVFRSRNGQRITGRRLDYIAQRWQKSLPWALHEQVAFHHLRHTMAAVLGVKGPQYKKRYLRHADNVVTEKYGKCPLDEFAAVMANLLGFEHPLVDGIDKRRDETMRRLGLPCGYDFA